MCFFFLAILAVICNLSVPLQVASSKVLSEMVDYLIHVIKNATLVMNSLRNCSMLILFKFEGLCIDVYSSVQKRGNVAVISQSVL